jgi:hypothetical protein
MKSKLFYLIALLLSINVVVFGQSKPISQYPPTATLGEMDDFIVNYWNGMTYTTKRINSTNLAEALSAWLSITNGSGFDTNSNYSVSGIWTFTGTLSVSNISADTFYATNLVTQSITGAPYITNNDTRNIVFSGNVSGGNIITTNSSPLQIGRNSAAGSSNMVVIGHYAGQNSGNSTDSSFIGYSAGQYASNSSASFFHGNSAGRYATNADNCVIIGNYAGEQLTSDTAGGHRANILIGSNALRRNNQAGYTTAIGYQAGENTITGTRNQMLGYLAGGNATNLNYSILMGHQAGQYAAQGYYVNEIGYMAGQYATNADYNAYFGGYAGQYSGSANNSILIGYEAGRYMGNSDNSIMIGYDSGKYATNASKSIFIGSYSGHTNDNILWIDTQATGHGYVPMIYGEFDNRLLRVNGKLDVTNNVTANGYFINTNSAPPIAAEYGGQAYFWNSNATVYLLTSTPNSTNWAATNKIGP